MTQSELCGMICQPLQTIHSSLQKMKADDYIRLEKIEGSRNKKIHLTTKGVELARMTVDKVIAAEKRAFSELTSDETFLLLATFRSYTDILKKITEELHITEWK